MDPLKFVRDNTYGINQLNISPEKKVDKLLIFFSSACAATAAQPIPFADIFILTPMQLYMGTLIAEARGYKFSMSEIVRIPSDKPLIDPDIVDKCIQIFLSKKYDYITTFLEPSFPYGTEVEIFSFDALEKTWKNAKLPSEHENVTPYIYNNKDKFQIYNVKNSIDLSHLRWVVDRAEDLELVRQLVSKIDKDPILMQDILEVFESDPKLAEINSNVRHDEGYKKSLKKDQEFIKRGKTSDEK